MVSLHFLKMGAFTLPDLECSLRYYAYLSFFSLYIVQSSFLFPESSGGSVGQVPFLRRVLSF